MEYFDEYGGGVDGEGEFVGVFDVVVPFEGEEHGCGLVDEYLTAKIGLFLVLLDEKAVGTSVEAPVDVRCTLARVVVAVVGEFDGESVEWTAVSSCNETLDHLACEEVEGMITGNLFLVHPL